LPTLVLLSLLVGFFLFYCGLIGSSHFARNITHTHTSSVLYPTISSTTGDGLVYAFSGDKLRIIRGGSDYLRLEMLPIFGLI
jgi:hypothetical protein